jgi:hypothetical protein
MCTFQKLNVEKFVFCSQGVVASYNLNAISYAIHVLNFIEQKELDDEYLCDCYAIFIYIHIWQVS